MKKCFLDWQQQFLFFLWHWEFYISQCHLDGTFPPTSVLRSYLFCLLGSYCSWLFSGPVSWACAEQDHELVTVTVGLETTPGVEPGPTAKAAVSPRKCCGRRHATVDDAAQEVYSRRRWTRTRTTTPISARISSVSNDSPRSVSNDNVDWS